MLFSFEKLEGNGWFFDERGEPEYSENKRTHC